FPLHLSRNSIMATVFLAQPIAEFDGIVQPHEANWMSLVPRDTRVVPDVFSAPDKLTSCFVPLMPSPGLLSFGLVVRRRYEVPELPDRNFMNAHQEGLWDNHPTGGTLTSNGLLQHVFDTGSCEYIFDLGRRASHRKLAWRNEAQLHADGISELDWHAEVLGPCLLMGLRLRRIKWGDRKRRRLLHKRWSSRGKRRRIATGRDCYGRQRPPAQMCQPGKLSQGQRK